MWIYKFFLISLAAAVPMLAQVPQAAEPQLSAQDAFQRLPPMLPQGQQLQAPVRMRAAPSKSVAVPMRALASGQCAIPLLQVTPDNKTQYAIREITPPTDPAGAMIYVTTLPVCGETGQNSKSGSNLGTGGPIKK
jgi:hypothetical protein